MKSYIIQVSLIIFKDFPIFFHTSDHFPDFLRPGKFQLKIPNFPNTNPVRTYHTQLTKDYGVFGQHSCKSDANVRHSVPVKRQQRRKEIVGKVSLGVGGVARRQNAVAEQHKPTQSHRAAVTACVSHSSNLCRALYCVNCHLCTTPLRDFTTQTACLESN